MRVLPAPCVYTPDSRPFLMSLPRLPPHPPTDPDAPDEDDERAFEAFAQDEDPIDIEAATWASRRYNGLDARGEAELKAWLDADPRHARAFEDMNALLGGVKQMPEDDVAKLRTGLPENAAIANTKTGPARPSRLPSAPGHLGARWFDGLGRWQTLLPHAVAALIAFASVGAGWMGWDHWRQQPVFEQTLATGQGRQLSATLPDAGTVAAATGSALQLDTASRADVRLFRDRREVHLRHGQAMFTVHADAQRPFHVHAGALRITVVGTRFSVRHADTGLDAGRTVVSVEEGRVRVARVTPRGADQTGTTEIVAAAQASVELGAGDQLSADEHGQLEPVARVPVHAIAPWRNGRLSFDQTPLAQAIAEFDRYGRTGMVVHDPAVASLPVGGSYSLRQWQRFAESLPQVLPVRLVRRGDVTEVVAR